MGSPFAAFRYDSRVQPALVTPVGLVLALAFGQLAALILGENVLVGLLLGCGLVVSQAGDALWERRRARRG